MTTVRSTHNSTISTTITACILSSIFSSCVTYFYYHHQHHRSKKQPLNDVHNHQQPPTQDQSNIEHRLNEQRLAERRGRIKAEVRLRSLLKEKNESQPSQPSEPTTTTITTTQQPKRSNGTHPMLLRCIGTVTTPFTKRMGTPRQGALAPHSRGYIQLDPTVAPMETLHGIEEYSHIWLLFAFHANTDTLESRKTKIRPPRKQGGGGRKTVGTMASRSPHRPNAIGLSLVKVGMVDEKQKRLYVSALDLVNGTPVYGSFLFLLLLFGIPEKTLGRLEGVVRCSLLIGCMLVVYRFVVRCSFLVVGWADCCLVFFPLLRGGWEGVVVLRR